MVLTEPSYGIQFLWGMDDEQGTDSATQWRFLIYGINPTYNTAVSANPQRSVVETYGTLLKYGNSDVDSSGRVSTSGLKITDFYNKSESYEIGGSTSSEIELEFINDDGFMNTFPWNWMYFLYADFFDTLNEDWVSVPLGVYQFEKPTKVDGLIVRVKGHDNMQRIESCSASGLFDSLTFDSDPSYTATLKDIYDALVSLVNQKLQEQTVNYSGIFSGMTVRWDPTNVRNIYTPNAEHPFVVAPFDPSQYNCRQVLEWIAGMTGQNAYVSRDGYVKLKNFTDAKYRRPNNTYAYYTIDTTSGPTDAISVSKSEYETPPIDRLEINIVGGQTVSHGTGSNKMVISGNPLFKDDDSADVIENVYNEVVGLQAYTPMSIRCLISPNIEAGDMIRVILGGVTYHVPIFQQTITWRKGPFVSEIVSSGLEFRTNEMEQATQIDDLSVRLDSVESDVCSFENGFVPRRSVESGATEDIYIPFTKTHKTIPNVVASIMSNQTIGMGECNETIWNVTTDGFYLRLTNNSEYTRSLGAMWIAVENLNVSKEVVVAVLKSIYLMRTTSYNADAINLDKIVGGTVAWNQLVEHGNFDAKNGWSAANMTLSISGNKCTATITSAHTNDSLRRDINMTANHVYLASAFLTPSKATSAAFYIGQSLYGLTDIAANTRTHIATIGKPSASGIRLYVYCNRGLGLAVNDTCIYENVMYIDLTAMFGSTIADYVYTLESGTAGAGIAWLKKYGYFTKPYYPYAAANLQSVKTSAHKTYGFNAYNPSTGKAKVVGGMVYQITGAYTALSLDGTSITPDANGYFTPSANGELTVTGGNSTTTCIHLKWDGERDGEWEEFSEHTYALDDVELRGIPKLDASNNLYYDGDTYEADGTVTRKYAIRAYTSGDATDGSTMITDGTNTVYKLTTPTTESAEPYTNPQACVRNGTEEFVDNRTVPIPVQSEETFKRGAV